MSIWARCWAVRCRLIMSLQQPHWAGVRTSPLGQLGKWGLDGAGTCPWWSLAAQQSQCLSIPNGVTVTTTLLPQLWGAQVLGRKSVRGRRLVDSLGITRPPNSVLKRPALPPGPTHHSPSWSWA